MTKTIQLEVSILVQGFFPIRGYSIDGFELQSISTNGDLMDDLLLNHSMYTPIHLLDATFQAKGELDSKYLVLINKSYAIDLHYDLDNINKKQINNQIAENIELKRGDLDRELKLKTNIDIALPIIFAKRGALEEIGRISVGSISSHFSNLQVSDYTPHLKDLLRKRLNTGFSIDSLEILGKKNSRFKRAFVFYFSAFRIVDMNARFTLLFSSLESLFNLDKKNVTHNIAEKCSLLFFMDEKKQKKIYYKIKDFYGMRSLYIHGDKPKEIDHKIELSLREIVHYVILVYWFISLHEQITDTEGVINFIRNNDIHDIDPKIRKFVSLLGIRGV